MIRLSDLSLGQSGKLVRIDDGAECLDRLVELGFTEGEEIRVLRRAPLGGPIQVQIRDTDYAICRTDAQFIRVSV